MRKQEKWQHQGAGIPCLHPPAELIAIRASYLLPPSPSLSAPCFLPKAVFSSPLRLSPIQTSIILFSFFMQLQKQNCAGVLLHCCVPVFLPLPVCYLCLGNCVETENSVSTGLDRHVSCIFV